MKTLSPKLSPKAMAKVIEMWKPEKKRELLSYLARSFEQGLDREKLENLGWLALAQSSLRFWNNQEDAIYDRM